jgi:hypothetical protein
MFAIFCKQSVSLFDNLPINCYKITMQIPVVPELSGFQPTVYNPVFGINYLHLGSQDGVSLRLSQDGIDRLGREPEFADLLLRVGSFVTEHGLCYDNAEAMATYEPSNLLAQANDEEGKRFHPSSVFQPNALPDTIMKSYEYDPEGANLQFHVMSWLHSHVQKSGDTKLRIPKQYAQIEGPRGDKVNFMEHLGGISLRSVRHNIIKAKEADQQDAIELTDEVLRTTKERLRKATGNIGLFRRIILNDVHIGNVLILGNEGSINPDNLHEWPVGIIDQPISKSPGIGLGLIAESYGKNTRRIRQIFRAVTSGQTGRA